MPLSNLKLIINLHVLFFRSGANAGRPVVNVACIPGQQRPPPIPG